MIWSIVSKNEMEGFGTSPVFRFYEEALGSQNINLAVVEENDELAFLHEGDIALLRTASKSLIDTITEKGIKTTAEPYYLYELVNDKRRVSEYLNGKGIIAPLHYDLLGIKNGETYFVKPRFGSDSRGITTQSICHSHKEVVRQMDRIDNQYGEESVIEQFIDGREFTVAISKADKLHLWAMEVFTKDGIQTQEGKANYMEYGKPIEKRLETKIKDVARHTFNLLGIKHHARIDLRMDKNGWLYVIDINLLPGLGPTGDWARCLLLTENYSYIDALNAILASATKL